MKTKAKLILVALVSMWFVAGPLGAWPFGGYFPGNGVFTSVVATTSITANSGADNTGTSGVIIKGSTSAQDITLTMRPSQTWPVLVGRANTLNSCTTYDIFPNGAPATCGPGVSWIDVCDADLIANPSAAVHCTRAAATGQIDMVALNGATANAMALAVNGVTEALISNTSIIFSLGTAINIASGTALAITENQNNGTFSTITNTTSGTAAFTKFGESNGSTVGELYHFSTGYTANGAFQPNSTVLYSTGTNGVNVVAAGAAGIGFYTNGLATANLRESISSSGNITFGSSTTAEIAGSMTAPTSVNHGTLSADASNFIGRVTSIGAFTSVTLTFGASGFGTTAHCFTAIASAGAADLIKITPSATAPVFSCFDSTTGVAANCDDFEYQCWGH